MIQTNLYTCLILAVALPSGMVLGATGSGRPLTAVGLFYEFCVRAALAGGLLILAILAQGLGVPPSELFAAVPVGLLLLELGWAILRPAGAVSDD
ncbi:hypothetical protein [Rubellimicrobium arenae]|uniref:hypothetical protein n=1 Tax=Rubellimicrobium arenae TaxID=2817372 RepID=UPI001B30C154|nr:hypothetical protein [Rubellimicrobium arenae]